MSVLFLVHVEPVNERTCVMRMRACVPASGHVRVHVCVCAGVCARARARVCVRMHVCVCVFVCLHAGELCALHSKTQLLALPPLSLTPAAAAAAATR